MYTSLRKQCRQMQIQLPQTKVQDATQGLLAPQDAKASGGIEASPTRRQAALETPTEDLTSDSSDENINNK